MRMTKPPVNLTWSTTVDGLVPVQGTRGFRFCESVSSRTLNNYFKAIRVRHTSATTTHANTRVTEGNKVAGSQPVGRRQSRVSAHDGPTQKLLSVLKQTNATRTHYEARDHSPEDDPFIASPFSCQYVALDTFECKSHARSTCLPARVSSSRLLFFTCPLCTGSISAKDSHRQSRRTIVRTWRPA